MKFVGANIHRELTLGVWVDYCENILCALCVWRADLPLNIADIEDPLSVQGNGNWDFQFLMVLNTLTISLILIPPHLWECVF